MACWKILLLEAVPSWKNNRAKWCMFASQASLPALLSWSEGFEASEAGEDPLVVWWCGPNFGGLPGVN